MRALALCACLSLGYLHPIAVVAQYPSLLLTPGEQTAMLAEKANPTVWSRLVSRVTESTAATAPSYQRNHRARYVAASLGDRVAIAQTIGEEGVEQYASTRRMKQLLGPHGRSVSIGPDSVYWNRSSGRVRVLEAKGGSSSLKWTYGSLQGTNANTVRSAGGLLESRRAGAAEKRQAARIIKAAQSGHLETAVIRSQHILGTPRAPRQVGEVHTGNVAKEARLIERNLLKRKPELGPIFRRAAVEHRASRLAYLGANVTARAGFHRLVGDASVSGVTAAGGRGLQMAWRIGNRWFLPVGVSVAGVTMAIQSYHLAAHNISYADYIDAIAGPAVLLTFTGVGFGIGGMPGAAVGMVLALPVQMYMDWSNDQQLSEVQQEAIEMALRARYSGAPNSTGRIPLDIP